jgi:hypothetical protein
MTDSATAPGIAVTLWHQYHGPELRLRHISCSDKHVPDRPPSTPSRPKRIDDPRYHYFGWKKGMPALVVLFLRAEAWRVANPESEEAPPCLTGGRGSIAAMLDDSVTAPRNWVMGLCGASVRNGKSAGRSRLRELLSIINSDDSRPSIRHSQVAALGTIRSHSRGT